jgi:hypothetical protein
MQETTPDAIMVAASENTDSSKTSSSTDSVGGAPKKTDAKSNQLSNQVSEPEAQERVFITSEHPETPAPLNYQLIKSIITTHREMGYDHNGKHIVDSVSDALALRGINWTPAAKSLYDDVLNKEDVNRFITNLTILVRKRHQETGTCHRAFYTAILVSVFSYHAALKEDTESHIKLTFMWLFSELFTTTHTDDKLVARRCYPHSADHFKLDQARADAFMTPECYFGSWTWNQLSSKNPVIQAPLFFFLIYRSICNDPDYDAPKPPTARLNALFKLINNTLSNIRLNDIAELIDNCFTRFYDFVIMPFTQATRKLSLNDDLYNCIKISLGTLHELNQIDRHKFSDLNARWEIDLRHLLNWMVRYSDDPHEIRLLANLSKDKNASDEIKCLLIHTSLLLCARQPKPDPNQNKFAITVMLLALDNIQSDEVTFTPTQPLNQTRACTISFNVTALKQALQNDLLSCKSHNSMTLFLENYNTIMQQSTDHWNKRHRPRRLAEAFLYEHGPQIQHKSDAACALIKLLVCFICKEYADTKGFSNSEYSLEETEELFTHIITLFDTVQNEDFAVSLSDTCQITVNDVKTLRIFFGTCSVKSYCREEAVAELKRSNTPLAQACLKLHNTTQAWFSAHNAKKKSSNDAETTLLTDFLEAEDSDQRITDAQEYFSRAQAPYDGINQSATLDCFRLTLNTDDETVTQTFEQAQVLKTYQCLHGLAQVANQDHQQTKATLTHALDQLKRIQSSIVTLNFVDQNIDQLTISTEALREKLNAQILRHDLYHYNQTMYDFFNRHDNLSPKDFTTHSSEFSSSNFDHEHFYLTLFLKMMLSYLFSSIDALSITHHRIKNDAYPHPEPGNEAAKMHYYSTMTTVCDNAIKVLTNYTSPTCKVGAFSVDESTFETLKLFTTCIQNFDKTASSDSPERRVLTKTNTPFARACIAELNTIYNTFYRNTLMSILTKKLQNKSSSQDALAAFLFHDKTQHDDLERAWIKDIEKSVGTLSKPSYEGFTAADFTALFDKPPTSLEASDKSIYSVDGTSEGPAPKTTRTFWAPVNAPPIQTHNTADQTTTSIPSIPKPPATAPTLDPKQVISSMAGLFQQLTPQHQQEALEVLKQDTSRPAPDHRG